MPNADEEGKDHDLSRGECQPVAEENLSQFLKGTVVRATASGRNTISTNRQERKAS